MSDQRDITQREIDVARDKANVGGPAQTYARVRTNRNGSRVVPKRIDFGLTFIEKPWVAYGVEIDLDAIEEAYEDNVEGENGVPVGGEFNFGDLPLCTGYVTEWDLDSHDHYIGAWVAVQVVFPDFANETTNLLNFETYEQDALIPLVHHFTWSGLAIKEVADSAQDAPAVPVINT